MIIPIRCFSCGKVDAFILIRDSRLNRYLRRSSQTFGSDTLNSSTMKTRKRCQTGAWGGVDRGDLNGKG